MIITKAVDTIFLCQCLLGQTCVRQPQIVKTKICRQVGLMMPFEQGLCPGYICPFCKSFTPPIIVLRDWMVLRKVNGDGSYVTHVSVFKITWPPVTVLLRSRVRCTPFFILPAVIQLLLQTGSRINRETGRRVV